MGRRAGRVGVGVEGSEGGGRGVCVWGGGGRGRALSTPMFINILPHPNQPEIWTLISTTQKKWYANIDIVESHKTLPLTPTNDPDASRRVSVKRTQKTNKYVSVKRTQRTNKYVGVKSCLLYTSPSPRDAHRSRMPSSA